MVCVTVVLSYNVSKGEMQFVRPI